ncbi:hypothetical protein [Halostagnicola bangensis]
MHRIDHVHVNDPSENVEKHDAWLQEDLDFQLNERVEVGVA